MTFSNQPVSLVALLLLASTLTYNVNSFVTPSLVGQKTTFKLDAVSTETKPNVDKISPEHPLRVVIAGAGVGGLSLSNSLSKNPNMHVTVIERTEKFKRFGGPIQLASNALQIIKTMDESVFDKVMEKFTITGDKTNGIKDGIRTEW